MRYIKRIARFLHITDSDGNLDLVDLSFVATMIKIIISPGIDFPSVCAMIPVLLAKMHVTQLKYKSSIKEEVQESVEES